MLNIGLVGLGHHGRLAVMPALLSHAKRGRLVAVADVDPRMLAQVDLPGVRCYSDHRKMLESEPGMDTVFIATLADTHASIAIDSLRSGRHVICEKPMAGNVRDCQLMVDAAEESRRLLIVDFELRVRSEQQQIRRWIREGLIGRVGAIHLQRMWDGHKTQGPLSQRRARLMSEAGGLDCGVHDIDFVRFHAGGKWQTIHAMGAWFGEPFSPPPHIAIIGRMDNGVLATVNASMGYASQIEPRPMHDFLVIVGDEGVVQMAISADSPDEFHQPATIKLFSRREVTAIQSRKADHSDSIAVLVDTVASIVDGTVSVEDSGLATGLDGLIAQDVVERANRQAIVERQAWSS
jgi:predicted dehydrogenase